jgi:hypothetical protein
VIYGPNAATAGAATLPALPANSVVIQEFAVSNTGVITLVAASRAPWVTARGGIQPVDAVDVVPGAYVGQYRDHPANGLQRWDGTVWRDARTAPTLRAVLAAAGSHGSTNQWLALTYTSERIDNWGMYSAGVITIPITGYYQLNASVTFAASNVGSRGLAWYNNTAAAEILAGATLFGSNPVSGHGTVIVTPTVIEEFTAGTQLTVRAYQNSGAALGILATAGQGTGMSVRMLEQTG